jgi:hypothetical protein
MAMVDVDVAWAGAARQDLTAEPCGSERSRVVATDRTGRHAV